MNGHAIQVMDGSFAIARLEPESPIPFWATRGEFHCLFRTPDELSIVCEQDLVPTGVRAETQWACLKVLGPLDLSEIGILASLARPLAEAGVSLFALSTFDTDYLLVRHTELETAVAALHEADWVVHRADSSPARGSA